VFFNQFLNQKHFFAALGGLKKVSI